MGLSVGDIITSPRSAAPSTRTATCRTATASRAGTTTSTGGRSCTGSSSIAFGYLTICMGWVWHVGLARERKLDKSTASRGQAVQTTHSHRIASQSLSYVISSAVPWLWGLIINTFDLPYFRGFRLGRAHPPDVSSAQKDVRIVNAIISPLQGLFNFFGVRPAQVH